MVMRTEQSTKLLYHISYGGRGCARKTSLSPRLFITDRSKAVLLLWFISFRFRFINVACCMTLCPPDDYSAVRIALCIYLFRPS